MNPIPATISQLLHPYQIARLTTALEVYHIEPAAIESGDTGTGKTYVLAALCKILELRPLIIAPKMVISTWFKVLALFDVPALGVTNYELAKNCKWYTSVEMYDTEQRVVCPHICKVRVNGHNEYAWNMPPASIIIFDEAHKGKNACTINSRLLMAVKDIIGIGALPRLILVSATITDRVDCFRIAAYLLGLAQYELRAYNIWLRLKAKDYPNAGVVLMLHQIVFPRFGTRMRISDIQADADPIMAAIFKQNDVRAETYMMTPENEQEIILAYDQIDRANAALKLKQKTDDHPLVMILRARQRIEMLKVPTLILEAMEYLCANFAVVIFVNFVDTVDALVGPLQEFIQEEYDGYITFITGGQSAEERAYNIGSFQNGKSRLLISMTMAGGVGTSLHHIDPDASVRPRVSLISPPVSGILLKQILGRIHRAGAISNAIQRIIYCKGRVSPADNLALACTTDTTFTAGLRRVGVEELLAIAVNKRLQDIEWINNGDDDDLCTI